MLSKCKSLINIGNVVNDIKNWRRLLTVVALLFCYANAMKAFEISFELLAGAPTLLAGSPTLLAGGSTL